MEKDMITLTVIATIVLLALTFLIVAIVKQRETNRLTQRMLGDRDLLRMIDTEPDQLLSPHQLRDKTDLTLTEARARLTSLHSFGVLRVNGNRRGRHFFGLNRGLVEAPDLNLSPEPFLTVEDLLNIFATYDYRVTPQELIMSTGLPLAIIKREMKYFENQKIVQRLQRMDANGMTVHRFYVLQDPYRSDPDRFRVQADKLDLEMREILLNDNLIV
ncbi:MAG: hypothetical protein ACI81P_000903 [Neolewinella sp.]|jgi:hypothetical protein